MRRISGPPLCGFHWCFEQAYGDPTTPEPYATVTPARVGKSLLPFPCPKCAAVVEVCDLQRDLARGYTWCQRCGWRFRLNDNGAPLTITLRPGAEAAPAVVS